MDPRRKTLDTVRLANDSAALRTSAEADLKAVIPEFAADLQPSAPVPAPVVNVEPVEPALKKKKLLSRLEQRRAARVEAASCGGGSGMVEAQGPGRRVLIEREVLVYVVEKEQLDGNDFNVLGVWNRRSTDGAYIYIYGRIYIYQVHIRPTAGKVTSPADMPYLYSVCRSVVPWDRGHQLSGQAQFLDARSPNWRPALQYACLHGRSSA